MQKGSAFPWRAVADNGFTLASCREKKLEKRKLRRFHLHRKSSIAFDGIKAKFYCLPQNGFYSCLLGMRSVFRVAGIDTERTAMSLEFFDVKNLQSMRLQDSNCSEQREIREVFMVNGVELVVFDQPQQMGEFQGDYSPLFEQD